MTANDSRRARFEEWVSRHHPDAPLDRIPSRPDDYDGVLAAWTWAAWQAASAQPLALAEPVACTYLVQALVPESRAVTHVALYRPLDAGTLLYTAAALPFATASAVEAPMELAGARAGAAFRQSVGNSVFP